MFTLLGKLFALAFKLIFALLVVALGICAFAFAGCLMFSPLIFLVWLLW